MSKKKARCPAKKNNLLRSRWLWAGLAVIVVIIAAFAVLQSRNQGTAAASSAPAEITVAEAAAKRDSGAFILDVREPDEWDEYHVPDSTLIPLDELSTRLSEVPRDQEIVVVCRSGNRSKSGRDILVEAGFTNVTSMAGGLKEWSAAGYPTVAGS